MVKVDKIILLVSSFIFVIYLFFILLTLICHLCPNVRYKDHTYNPFWCDYAFLLIFTLIDIFLYITYISKYEINSNDENNKDKFCIAINALLNTLFFAFSTNLLINIITSFRIQVQIKKMKAIKAKDVETLSSEIKKINPTLVTPGKTHLKEFIFCILLNIIYLVAYCLACQFSLFEKDTKKKETSLKIFDQVGYKLLFIFLIIYIILEVICIGLLSSGKNRLLENYSHSKLLTVQAKYNLSISKIAFYSDFTTQKLIIDLVGVIPMFIYLGVQKFTIVSLIFYYLIHAIYFLFTGSLYAYVDHSLKNSVNPWIKRSTCYKKFSFNFGQKERAKLFSEFLLDNDIEDNYLQMTEKNNVYPLMRPDDDEDSLKNKEKKEMKSDYKVVNYYLILKMIYEYYIRNEENIDDLFKQRMSISNENFKGNLELIDDNLTLIETDILRKDDGDMGEITNEIKHLNETSILESKKYFDFEINLFNKCEFYSLFPYYQVEINKIIRSLAPKKNVPYLKKFEISKKNDKDYNTYYTYDKYLYFEVYDDELNQKNTDFIPADKIDMFAKKYKDIYINIFNNNQKTLLPSILGIFKISYKKFNKFIVLYLNPLYFTSDIIKCDYSAIISFKEGETKKINLELESSYMKELEDLKAELTLKEDSFQNITKIIDDDYNIIKNLGFISFFKINVGVILIESDDEYYSILESDKIGKTECIEKIQLENKNYVIKFFIGELFRTNIFDTIKMANKRANSTYFTSVKSQLRNFFVGTVERSTTYRRSQEFGSESSSKSSYAFTGSQNKNIFG